MKHSWLNLRVSVVRVRQGAVVAQLPSHVRLFGTHGLQHARLHCPSPSPRVCPSSHPLNQWCHPTISSSSATLFSFGLQSFPASGSFPMSQFFASGSQTIGVSASASVLPMSIQGWVPLRLTGLISLLSKGLPRIFSSTTIQVSILQHSAFFMVQLSHSYMTTAKTIALTIQIFVTKVMSLLFNTHHLLISLLQSPSVVILEPKRKSITASAFSPSICHEVMGPETVRSNS